MEWNDLKANIYFKDGSLRDIYVLITNMDDWEKWTEVVNQNYVVEFYDRRTGSKISSIDFNKVIECWQGINEDGVYAIINLDGILLNCYFTDKSEIENDFSPNEIKTITDHNSLMKYLTGISKTLNKPVLITSEMRKSEVLVNVLHDEITYFPRCL